jgi:hypothetical protein
MVSDPSNNADHIRDRARRERFTMVYLIHDALRRDFGRLCAAVRAPTLDSAAAGPLHDRWRFVSDQLDHHHRTEDENMWPLVRPKLAGVDADLEVIERMEAQHRTLDPASDAVERAFAAYLAKTGNVEELATEFGDLRARVESHLDDEERHAFPVIDRVLTDEEFQSFEKAVAKAVGMRGAAAFFPWILDSAAPGDQQAALAVLPAPIRFVCRRRWIPRYERRIAAHWRS